jgi:hypothetical protein
MTNKLSTIHFLASCIRCCCGGARGAIRSRRTACLTALCLFCGSARSPAEPCCSSIIRCCPILIYPCMNRWSRAFGSLFQWANLRARARATVVVIKVDSGVCVHVRGYSCRASQLFRKCLYAGSFSGLAESSLFRSVVEILPHLHLHRWLGGDRRISPLSPA